jgi:hypothetical protein
VSGIAGGWGCVQSAGGECVGGKSSVVTDWGGIGVGGEDRGKRG